MEVGPGTHEGSRAKDPVDEGGDPFAVPAGLRADLFNWAHALGSFHEEPLTASSQFDPSMDKDIADNTVAVWRPGADMSFALKRLNK